jgi:hypothetical protein
MSDFVNVVDIETHIAIWYYTADIELHMIKTRIQQVRPLHYCNINLKIHD